MFNRSFRLSILFIATVFLVFNYLKPANSFFSISDRYNSNVSSIAESMISPSQKRAIRSTITFETNGEKFILPLLRYEYDALEPNIDRETMTLHHDRHHAGYVENLNGAIASHPELATSSIETLLTNLDSIPEDIRQTVRNNGGGHYNHSLFWSVMTPGGSEPLGAIKEAIDTTFDDFETFKTQFNEAGSSVFGSGWVWLVINADDSLEIVTTPNQDSPLMNGKYPLFGNDVWEHAYYLKYRNKRTDYLDNWWNVVDWEAVNERFESAKSKKV